MIPSATVTVLVELQLQMLRQALARLTPDRTSAGYRAAPGDFESLISDACRRHGVDPSLVKGLIKAESGFDPQAVSRAGAKGLMQLMDSTAASLGVTDPFDPAQNVEAGVRLLSSLLDRYGDERLALAAYNAGPGAVDRAGGVPDIAETQVYVPRVLAYREEFSRSGGWEA